MPRRAAGAGSTAAFLLASPARAQCEISPKKSAALVRKALLQAKANAVTNAGLMESHLRVGAPRRAAQGLLAVSVVWQPLAARASATPLRRCAAAARRLFARSLTSDPPLACAAAPTLQPRRGWARAST